MIHELFLTDNRAQQMETQRKYASYFYMQFSLQKCSNRCLLLQIIQGSSTHKTQLMELSLMREEEKQNYKRQEENLVSCGTSFCSYLFKSTVYSDYPNTSKFSAFLPNRFPLVCNSLKLRNYFQTGIKIWFPIVSLFTANKIQEPT